MPKYIVPVLDHQEDGTSLYGLFRVSAQNKTLARMKVLNWINKVESEEIIKWVDGEDEDDIVDAELLIEQKSWLYNEEDSGYQGIEVYGAQTEENFTKVK